MTHQLHQYSELRQKDIFCDAVIRVDDGTEFSVHRVVLSTCSDYFLALFRNENNSANRSRPVKKPRKAQPPTEDSYKIVGIRSPAMELVLDYIYDAKCGINTQNMVELLLVGDYLGVLGLVKYSEDFIISALDTENSVSMMRFGKHREYPRLFEAAKLFILSHFVELMTVQRSAMLELSMELFLELLSDDRLRVKQEDQVCEACLAWLGEKKERKQHLVALLLSCRLSLITPQFFNERIREHPLVRASEQCKGIICDAMKIRAGLEVSSVNVRI